MRSGVDISGEIMKDTLYKHRMDFLNEVKDGGKRGIIAKIDFIDRCGVVALDISMRREKEIADEVDKMFNPKREILPIYRIDPEIDAKVFATYSDTELAVALMHLGYLKITNKRLRGLYYERR